jgi:lysophospholipase L1-like esterase
MMTCRICSWPLIVAFVTLTWGAAVAQSATHGMVDDPCAPPPPGANPSAVLTPPPSLDPMAEAERRRMERIVRDWPQLCVFRAANAALIAGRARPRLILIGDSITGGWPSEDPDLFGGPGGEGDIVDRGIAGQTSGQMLARFYQDVIQLTPRTVQIMAGTNDIAGNAGPNRPEDFKANIMAMTELARAHGIRIILASIPPSDHFAWAPDVAPKPWVATLNRWLRDYARANRLTYADYYSALAGPDGAMRSDFSSDGVHPNLAGYAAMRPVLDAALANGAPP